jgi:3-isopropylmalate dehydratase small subunit
MTAKTDEDFGAHVLEFTHLDFRDKVKGGQNVVVTGKAFGGGSSREVAVSALKGSFSYITCTTCPLIPCQVLEYRL